MEDLLKTILLEVRNLSYLFFGYAVIWLFLFGTYIPFRAENAISEMKSNA